jgi:hypothetical protein
MDSEKALELYRAGREAAERFLEAWSFEGYIVEFWRGREHSRHREVAEQMTRVAMS